MSEGKMTVDKAEVSNYSFNDQVMNEIGSLREELTAIRQLLEREHSLDKAVQEYRCIPSNQMRWGFIGVWGKGGSNCSISVHTSSQEEYFDAPDGSDENAAAFAAAFTNPDTIGICKHLFRGGGRSREEIKKERKLSDEELDAAVEPLLEWYYAEWRDGRLETSGPGLNGQGVNYAVTLVVMTKMAADNKAHHGKSTE